MILLQDILKKYRFDLPPGIEYDYASWEKITTFVTHSLTQWRARLKRHFWRVGYFEALLGRLTQGAASDAQRLLGSLGGLSQSESHAAIEGLMDLVADAPQGARTREEIVERLMEQAADAAALRLDPKIADVITRRLLPHHQ